VEKFERRRHWKEGEDEEDETKREKSQPTVLVTCIADIEFILRYKGSR
jgi:hypothetical protein